MGSTPVADDPRPLGPSSEPPASAWGFFVRGWRPFAGWMCGLVLVMHALALPIIQLIRFQPVAPIDWTAITVFAGLLIAARAFDKSQGTA